MSHIDNIWPCRHTARKIPETENNANIFFLASGPAFFHLSIQTGKSERGSSDSVTAFNQSSSASSSPAGRLAFVTPSSINLSTSTVLIHRGDDDCRLSARGCPARIDASTSLSELFPSMAAIIEYINEGSSFTLYMHGGHVAIFR